MPVFLERDSSRQARKLANEFRNWALTPLSAACCWAVSVWLAGTGGTLIAGKVGGATVVVGVVSVRGMVVLGLVLEGIELVAAVVGIREVAGTRIVVRGTSVVGGGSADITAWVVMGGVNIFDGTGSTGTVEEGNGKLVSTAVEGIVERVIGRELPGVLEVEVLAQLDGAIRAGMSSRT